jgi:glutamate-ammonia-ligase adenylyltransferase
MIATQGKQMVKAALARAKSHSPFLRQQIVSHPAIATLLADERLADALATAWDAGRDAPDLMTSLRRRRGALSLALAVGDLAGALSLEEVVIALSDLADRSLESAVEAAIAERTPDAEPRGFAIIALGKHGSRELNFSSDVDLLFLFDPATLPLKPREETAQAAVRIGQRVIEYLQRRDGSGHVFRVDLRLRPSPEITPIALPVDAAIGYYESSALPWERAAFIRARFVAGDAAIGRYFLDAIHPFVWRRSLDFGAIGEIQSITRRIRGHFAAGQKFGPGFDLKRGQGGIREIEFFAQVHELIHGGRHPALRAPATLDALAALAAAKVIEEAEADDLGNAYRLLRTIEHRLQMIEDKQTHSLPGDDAALDNVARLHGLEDRQALLDLLKAPVARVAAIYGRLGHDEGIRLPRDAQALEADLASLGFDDPVAARLRIESWRSGKARSLRTGAAGEAFEAMLPALVEALGAAAEPMRAMNRFDDIVSRLPSGINFYRLLEAQPALTGLLATILSHAPALAEQLGRRPELLDGLISKSSFEPARPVDALVADFVNAERGGEDYQTLLDRIRRRVNDARFALGVQLITARSDPLEVAGGYARIAEAAMHVLADATIAEFAKIHGRVPGAELLILGLGRLGGEALTHASDLDIIYLFSGGHEARSNGPRPLGATDYFNRLAPRVTAALSVPTAAGALYDVDTRLRPSGKDGLLAVSLASFDEYQRDHAWTWEHMALTRARPVYGSTGGRAALQQVIDGILRQPRDPKKLVTDAAAMRREMAAHKPAKGPFDIKLGEGGLVDLEFAIQTIQLREHKGLTPQLGLAITELAAEGLVPPPIVEAHQLLARLLLTLRLVSPASVEPPEASRALVATACGHQSWEALMAAHDAARRSVYQLWRDIASSQES